MEFLLGFGGLVLLAVALAVFFLGIRCVRPTHRALVERFGKYHHSSEPGFRWVIPLVDRMIRVNIIEQMVDAQPQEIITNDNLNAVVDAQGYFKVKMDEQRVMASQYGVQAYQVQIVNLVRATLRNIIGTLTLKSANSEREKINMALMETLSKETANWGIEIVRAELKQVDPPQDVQAMMNKVVKVENEKIAALDFANAREAEANGVKRAEVKKAEGIRQAKNVAALAGSTPILSK